MNTQYKKTLRTELARLNVDMNGFYFNDLCNNKSTSRRIKATVSRPLSINETFELQRGLESAFGVKISVKNYSYFGDTVVVYFRKWK